MENNICSKCGSELSEGQMFCPKCGAKSGKKRNIKNKRKTILICIASLVISLMVIFDGIAAIGTGVDLLNPTGDTVWNSHGHETDSSEIFKRKEVVNNISKAVFQAVESYWVDVSPEKSTFSLSSVTGGESSEHDFKGMIYLYDDSGRFLGLNIFSGHVSYDGEATIEIWE